MTSDAIQQFWSTFMDHKDHLAVPDNDMEDQMMVVLDSLKRVDPRLYYHVGYRDDGPDLLLSAEGHLNLAPTIVECIAQAPICAGWRFRPILESESLDGKRNHAVFPDDENGDILFDIAVRGGDLVSLQEVDFCHVFPSEFAARSFASRLPDSDETTIEAYNEAAGFTWEVCVTRKMHPTHHNITAHETNLAVLADRHEGQPDGWGFMSK